MSGSSPLALAVTAAALLLAACSPASLSERTVAEKPVATSSAVTSASAGATVPAEASVPPEPRALPADGKLVFSGDRSVKKVALTFDLCETPNSPAGFDDKLVGVLISRQVPATFMMGGHWASTHQSDARLLGSTPFFEIGNHSYAHKHPTRVSAAAFRDEIELAQRQIEAYAGVTPRVFRFPYGEHDARTLGIVKDAHLVPIQWNVETGDPDRNVSAADIVRVVKQQTRNGSIVIMHANGRGWHTAEALPEVVSWLRGQGYELVTVSDLLAPP